MLENINLERKLSREEYKRVIPSLQKRIYDLEKACWDHGLPSIIVFEGWEAAGKGSAISALTQRLDPRGFKLHAIQPPRTSEQQRPWLWRFWLKVPQKGEMLIFDSSWYRRVLAERVEGLADAAALRRGFADIIDFERTLAEDGVTFLKFFFHISRKEQKKRLRAIEADPLESWRVTPAEWKKYKKYNEYLEAAEEMLELTDAEYAPWIIVEATSGNYARRKVFESIVDGLEKRLGPNAPPRAESSEVNRKDADLRAVMESLEGARNSA
jgi:polyphosphate kinase 2 (PPK2 family)